MTVPIIPGGTLDVSNRPVRRPSDTGKYGVNWQPGMDRQNPPGGSTTTALPGGGGGGVQVVVSGPLFAGQVPGMIATMLDEMRYSVASQALAEVQLILDRSIQHPTPYYETQVTVQNVGTDWVVHDRGIIYGPWLEGVSHRNQTTRFKGYHAFRRATQEVMHRAQGLCQRVADRHIGRMS